MVTTLMYIPTAGNVVPSRVPSMSVPSPVDAAARCATFAGSVTNATSTHDNAWLGGTTGLGDTQGAHGTKRIHPGRLGGMT